MWGSTKETVLIRMAASESVCVSSCVLHLEVGMGDCLVCVDLVCVRVAFQCAYLRFSI